MTGKALRYALAFIVIAALALAWPRVALFIAVDKCLDAGGRWDESSDVCLGADKR